MNICNKYFVKISLGLELHLEMLFTIIIHVCTHAINWHRLVLTVMSFSQLFAKLHNHWKWKRLVSNDFQSEHLTRNSWPCPQLYIIYNHIWIPYSLVNTQSVYILVFSKAFDTLKSKYQDKNFCLNAYVYGVYFFKIDGINCSSRLKIICETKMKSGNHTNPQHPVNHPHNYWNVLWMHVKKTSTKWI